MVKNISKNFGFRELLNLVRGQSALFVLGMITLAAGSGITLLFPEIIRRILSGEQASRITENPWGVAGILIGLFALQGVCFYLRSLAFGVIGQRVLARIRNDLYTALLSKPISFFDAHPSGDLVSRISSDCALLQDAVSLKLSVMIRYSLQVIVGIALMVLLSPRLTIALAVMLPVLVLFSIYLGKKLKALSKRQQQELGAASAIAEEVFAGMRTVLAFNRRPYEEDRYRRSNARVLDVGIARTKLSAFFASFVNFLMNAAIVAVLIYGIALVGENKLSLGDLTAFMLYGAIVGVSFAFLSGTYSELVQSYGAGERITEFSSSASTTESATAANSISPAWDGSVRLQQITFAYPSRPDLPVLKNLSMTLTPGTTTALVGPSGSGKSTVVSLVLGLYPPTSGDLLFGSQSINSVAIETVREKIAVVSQDPILFSASIRENIRYGNLGASDQELTAACAKARILDFIESLPQGFETLVGERGTQLSGGQRQRVAIARAIIRNPQLLILDEATSALDSENEAAVQAALADVMQGRTCLVIAHRLSTVRSASQVVVLEQGSIVQHGTHADLMAQPGLYQQLAAHQFELRVG